MHNENNEALLFMGRKYVLNWKTASLIRDSHVRGSLSISYGTSAQWWMKD